jgi:hypothetical protein
LRLYFLGLISSTLVCVRVVCSYFATVSQHLRDSKYQSCILFIIPAALLKVWSQDFVPTMTTLVCIALNIVVLAEMPAYCSPFSFSNYLDGKLKKMAFFSGPKHWCVYLPSFT